MPIQPDRDRTGNQVPRWVATAGRRSLTGRLVARGARMFSLFSPGRARCGATVDHTDDAGHVPSLVRERVLRDYHAANLVLARRASEELVRAGFHTGAVPYGYRAQRVQVAPPGRRSRWRTRLVVEPVEAAVVTMIFTWRSTDRLSCDEIRNRLTRSRYPAPLDPATGQQRVWTPAAVRAILSNPKYTGHQVWGQRRHGRPTPAQEWVWSCACAHPPLITREEFALANLATGSR